MILKSIVERISELLGLRSRLAKVVRSLIVEQRGRFLSRYSPLALNPVKRKEI